VTGREFAINTGLTVLSTLKMCNYELFLPAQQRILRDN
jgi:hypothetical protein